MEKMMSNPLYQVGDEVYLLDSAKTGSVMSYMISGSRQMTDGSWVYKFCIPRRPPNNNATMGDRIKHGRDLDFELREAQLCSYCEAVEIALAYFRTQVSALEAQYNTYCTDTSSGGTSNGTNGTG